MLKKASKVIPVSIMMVIAVARVHILGFCLCCGVMLHNLFGLDSVLARFTHARHRTTRVLSATGSNRHDVPPKQN
jgi:hypothetical protein